MPARQRKKKTAEPKPPKEKLITRSTIMSDYGWTATLIKKYLPPPHAGGGGPRLRCYP